MLSLEVSVHEGGNPYPISLFLEANARTRCAKKALLKTIIRTHYSLITLLCGIRKVQWDEVGEEVRKRRKERVLNRRHRGSLICLK